MIALGALFTVGAIGWAATAGPVFRVRSIRIEGNTHIVKSEVIDLAGDVIGKHLTTLDFETIEQRLEAHPWILRSGAEWSLSGALLLSITERSAVAWARDPEGIVLLAADGVVLERSTSAPRGIEIPAITIAIEPGDRVPSPDLLAVAGSLPPEIRGRVDTIHPGPRGIVLDLRRGGLVLYGDATDRPEKAAAIASLLRWSEEQGIAVGYIDVRAPGTPTLKPAD
ncbi:MAG: cell division protein FtsQ/DivIB [Actinomycetota bacterium]